MITETAYFSTLYYRCWTCIPSYVVIISFVSPFRKKFDSKMVSNEVARLLQNFGIGVHWTVSILYCFPRAYDPGKRDETPSIPVQNSRNASCQVVFIGIYAIHSESIPRNQYNCPMDQIPTYRFYGRPDLYVDQFCEIKPSNSSSS